MVSHYNISDIQLGEPTFSGHESYINASLHPAHSKAKPVKVIFKKNKYGKSRLSRFEVAFNHLACLFFAKGTTAPQKLVIDDSGKTVGVATQHLCYVIEQKEGLKHPFYTLDAPEKGFHCSVKRVSQAEDIPYYFFDKLPQGFFASLLQAESDKLLTINYDSLASILGGAFFLEDDDFHRGNYGFYLVEKEGKPQVVFFKIDHELLFADSIMSCNALRPFHLFHGANVFDISAEDIKIFPITGSLNSYWPTKLGVFSKPWDNKEYHSFKDKDAFVSIAQRPEFKDKPKWKSFFRHIVIPRELVELSLKECLDETKATERAEIALITQATVARQAHLKSVLFSIKEFREFVAGLTTEDYLPIFNEITESIPDKTIRELVENTFSSYQELCRAEQLFDEEDTPLHIAIKLGDYRYEETLQTFGHFINVKNKAGKTPLDVALDKLKDNDQRSADVRTDLRFTMKHLLINGAEQSERFKTFNQQAHIESYSFQTPYLNAVGNARTYQQLKDVLSAIGEDHTFCLKSKKNLAIECVSAFISANTRNPEMQTILEQLKKDMNGESSPDECASLLFIRQLRSRLWIVRQIRGLYGWTTTQAEITEIINKELKRIEVKEPGSFLFFKGASAADSESKTNANDTVRLPK